MKPNHLVCLPSRCSGRYQSVSYWRNANVHFFFFQISILEAMKLEISVRLPEDLVTAASPPTTVEKVLVRPGDTVKAGGRIALVRRG